VVGLSNSLALARWEVPTAQGDNMVQVTATIVFDVLTDDAQEATNYMYQRLTHALAGQMFPEYQLTIRGANGERPRTSIVDWKVK
jgi:hypothetical protein